MKETPELTGDAALIAKWEAITDPLDALEEIVEHHQFLGSDPYYRELNDALLDMAERVVKAGRPGANQKHRSNES